MTLPNPEWEQEDERELSPDIALPVSEKEGRTIKKDGKQDEPDNKNNLGERYR